MNVNLTEAEVADLLKALDAWKESGRIGQAMLEAMLPLSGASARKGADSFEATIRAREHKAILLAGKLVQALNRESEHTPAS